MTHYCPGCRRRIVDYGPCPCTLPTPPAPPFRSPSRLERALDRILRR